AIKIKYDGKYYTGPEGRSLRITYQKAADGWAACWTFLNSDLAAGMDISSYNFLGFRVKGEKGGEMFNVNLVDTDDHTAAFSCMKYLFSGAGTEWQQVIIPFSDMPFEAVNLKNVKNISFDFPRIGKGILYIDQLELGYKKDLKITRDYSRLLKVKPGPGSAGTPLDWLRSQKGSMGLIRSFNDGTSLAHIYDQSLSVIAFSAAGERSMAEDILKFLAKHQSKNGSFPASYDAETGDVLNPVSYSGNNAWVLMAINYYTYTFKDNSFLAAGRRIGDYLLSRRDTDKVMLGSPGVKWVSVEHQADGYSALTYLCELTKDEKYRKAADEMRAWVEREMWILSKAQKGPKLNIPAFWTGRNDFGGISTDCQTWTILSFGPKNMKGEPAGRCLDWLLTSTCRVRADYGEIKAVDGFDFDSFELNFDDKKTPADESKQRSDTVWFEGTEGAACAFYFTGNTKTGDYFHGQSKRVMAASGGIPYSTPAFDLFGRSNFFLSLASTAWYEFNELKINPFRPDNRK
ncbi:MAG: carbohydrate binding domain-containing protein, partial [bacterium]|nr:carbohydrate binding domain-containing protein [bacterium]